MRLPAIDDPTELDAAVRFQAQEQIPMPLDQAVLDHRVVGGVPATEETAAQIDVILVAARRDMIDASLEPLRVAGLKPIGIDLSAFGLIRALGAAPSEPEGAGDRPRARPPSTATSATSTNLAVAKGRSCLFTRVAPVGLEDVVGDLTASSRLTDEHARMWMNHVGLAQQAEAVEGDPEIVGETRGALEAGASSLRDELRLSLDFYGAQEGAVPVDRVVLCGPGSDLPVWQRIWRPRSAFLSRSVAPGRWPISTPHPPHA